MTREVRCSSEEILKAYAVCSARLTVAVIVWFAGELLFVVFVMLVYRVQHRPSLDPPVPNNPRSHLNLSLLTAYCRMGSGLSCMEHLGFGGPKSKLCSRLGFECGSSLYSLISLLHPYQTTRDSVRQPHHHTRVLSPLAFAPYGTRSTSSRADNRCRESSKWARSTPSKEAMPIPCRVNASAAFPLPISRRHLSVCHL
ncbi:hypothetical protein BDV19DRAFT_159719 [Aspergillus venezuelensis]